MLLLLCYYISLLLWASKFARAKMECILEMGNQTPMGGTVYFAGDGTFRGKQVLLI